MTPLLQAARNILHFVNLEPGTPIQLIVELVAAALAAALTLHILARMFQVGRGAFGSSLMIVAVGGILTLAAASAFLVHFPDLAGKKPGVELVVGSFGVVSLLLVVPLIRMMWRSSYFSALVAYFLCAIAGAAMVFAVDGIFEAFSTGRKELDKGVRHNREIESLLDKR